MMRKMILFVGCLALMQGARAEPAYPIPFTGAFGEGALGFARSQALHIHATVSEGGTTVGDNTLDSGSKTSALGRLGGGYGYTFSSDFNLTGIVALSSKVKVDQIGSQLKNRFDVIVHPGYYIEKWRTLVYGSLGYSWATLDSPGDIGRLSFVSDSQDVRADTPDNIGAGESKLRGVLWGLGAKYAINEALYAGAEWNRVRYSGAQKEGDLSWNRFGQPRTTLPLTYVAWQRDDHLTINTYILMVGYRFH